ncbi:LOB domain-containing protein 39 isoform X2 [Arachis ipaensis]|uniref:LOB domain-containing protein n=1 Tax=Arachis hypogaea TaxID=3818 RepID=A0A444XWI6_ARAHY|nr:LOB domain-containing protein 39 isoform X2 [Arachis ipaensis]XP_025676664.1 LOB domain-containing protein 39 isoform X2 [Arachis hypogaea]RYQ93766.1 hypothetical protein Ahy_B09g100006 [Arachis hypogaea]
MDAVCYEKGAAKSACYDIAWCGYRTIHQHRVTPPSSSPSSSAAPTSCLSFPPFPPTTDPSLLYEAVGRTINPVSGAVGLLSTGNWHLCQSAVDKVLRGGGAALMESSDHLKEAESQERIEKGQPPSNTTTTHHWPSQTTETKLLTLFL